jgi:hypothetical protein
MHGKAADQKIASLGGVRNSVSVAFDLQQFAFRDQGVEAVGELAASRGFDSKFAQQLFVARRFFRLARKVAKDGGIGENERHFVIL